MVVIFEIKMTVFYTIGAIGGVLFLIWFIFDLWQEGFFNSAKDNEIIYQVKKERRGRWKKKK